jgi:outer membrane protein TolC
MRKICISTLLTLMAAAISAGASNPQFDALVDSVVAHNPEVKVAAANSRAALLTRAAENSLPETEVSYSHRWGNAEAGNRHGWEVTQGFDWPGVYAARRRGNSVASDAATAQLAALSHVKALEVRQLLYQIIDGNNRLTLLRNVAANVDSMTTAVDRLYNGGNVTILDVRKLEFERLAVQRQIDEAESNLAELNCQLAVMNGGAVISTTELTEYPDAVTDPIEVRDAANSPTLQALENELTLRRADLDVTRREQMPGFSVGYVNEVEAGESFNGFSVGVALPLFTSGRKRIAAAKAAVAAAEFEAESARAVRSEQLTADMAQLTRLKKQLEAYDRAFASNDYISLLSKSWRGGETTTLNYVQELNYYISVRLEYMALLLSYHQQAAELKAR